MLRRKRDQISWSNDDSCSNLSFETVGERDDPVAGAAVAGPGVASAFANPQSPPLQGLSLGAAVASATQHPSSFMSVQTDSLASIAGTTNGCCGDNLSTYTYSSQRSSSLAWDVSSMSPACSATRPQKRQRTTTLTDALQGIQLHRQIPEQIGPRNTLGYLPSMTKNDTIDMPTGRLHGSSFRYYHNIQDNPGLTSTGNGNDLLGQRSNALRVVDDYDDDDGYHQDKFGDCMFDDNSQLTTSDVDDGVEVEEEVGGVTPFGNVHNILVSTEEMEDGASQNDDEEHGVDKKAPRQAVRDLVVRKGMVDGVVPSSSHSSPLFHTAKMDDGVGQNPVNRKIEELLRLSLKNVQRGIHPLLLTTGNNDDDNDDDDSNDDDLDSSTRLTTHDVDMAVDDPTLYHHPSSFITTDSNNVSSVPFPVRNALSNCLENDGDYRYPPTWIKNKEAKLPSIAMPLPLPVKLGRSDSQNMSTSMSISDIDVEDGIV
jgi:hypothetical protein